MREDDAERIFEELKKEHLRALKAGDVEALQSFRDAIATERECKRSWTR